MESYMKINRGITLSNQHLRIKNSQLNAELIRVNKCLMDERAAHKDKTRKIINILSNSVSKIMNEILPDYIDNENNLSETPSRSLVSSNNNSTSSNLNKCNKSPLQIQNNLLKNITIRRNRIPSPIQNNSGSQNYVKEKENDKHQQHQLFHQEYDEAIITNREHNCDETVPQQLALTRDTDNSVDANCEVLGPIIEEDAVEDNEEDNYICVLSGQNDITIFNMENAPCSTPHNTNSKKEILENNRKKKLLVRVKRLKLSNSSRNKKTKIYSIQSSFDTVTTNSTISNSITNSTFYTSFIPESTESSNDHTILNPISQGKAPIDLQSIITDTNINSTSILSAESLQNSNNNLTLTRPKRKACIAIKSYSEFFN